MSARARAVDAGREPGLGARPRRALFRRLAWAALVATWGLLVLGGIVRITGSGMGCGDDWPLCRGRLLPPLELTALVEYAHRSAAALVSVLVLAVGGVAWTRHRLEPDLRRPATLAVGLLLLQVLLGAVTVRLELHAGSVVLHLMAAMLLLAALTVAALRSGSAGGSPAGLARGDGRPSRAAANAAVGLAFVTIVLGGVVANLNAGLACAGFPLCSGALFPKGGALAVLHWAHRLSAFLLVGLLAGVWMGAARRGAAGSIAARILAGALVLALVQVAIAAAMVLNLLPPGLRAAHLAAGALLWIALVATRHEAGREAVLVQRRVGERVRDAVAARPVSAGLGLEESPPYVRATEAE